MAWLDEGLLGGDVSNSGFVARISTLRDAPENSGTVMTYYNIESGVGKIDELLKDKARMKEMSENGIAEIVLNDNCIDIVY